MVESNVLLDVMTEDARWFPWSADAVRQAADLARLVIHPAMYAEASVRYQRISRNGTFCCHTRESGDPGSNWVPAFAGMTGRMGGHSKRT
jgi:hypothetical protein